MTTIAIDIAAAELASQEAVSHCLENDENPSRWDMVPAALAAQIALQIGDAVIVEGLDDVSLRVMQCDAEGTILPPSEEGRAAFDAVAAALAGTPYGVQYQALNGSWDHLEDYRPGK